jgi:hypothetical protein
LSEVTVLAGPQLALVRVRVGLGLGLGG